MNVPGGAVLGARRICSLLAATLLASRIAAQSVGLSPLFVTASRSTESVTSIPFSHVSIAGDDLRRSPAVTVDGLLRGVAGFSLFRRSDSLVSNPTTQGVSLRGLGPSGASRSLVLLDGIPLNDAFGGWVLWSKVPRESLARVELVPGGGGSAWGNAALGGVVQLFTETPADARERLAVRAGSHGTHDVEAQATRLVGSGTFQLLGRSLGTDGYVTVAPEDRGPIDQPASSRARWLTGRWRQPLGSGLTATVTARTFADERSNGTPYQENTSREDFVSVAVDVLRASGVQWHGTVYVQGQNFTSTFSSVNADRTAETPASNQYAVPSTVVGLALVGERTDAADARTTFGFDLRDVRGETREESAYSEGTFARRRFAGGRQTTGGVFALQSRPLAPAVRGSLGLRLDGWWETDGHRRDYLNAAPVSDTRFGARDGWQFSPSGGLVWDPAGPLRVHASGQHAFRRPTLNELHRAFRVGNVITDGNPDLRTEKVTSAEIGATLRSGSWRLGVAGFWNDLRDAVANVTVAQGPITLPGIGFVPAGGEGRRKMNLDRSRVQGVAIDAGWDLTRSLSAEAGYLWEDATVRRAGVAPWLVGRRLAQVQRQSGTAGVSWRSARWSAHARARWMGEQFEDDTNSLRLAAATVIDVSAAIAAGRHAEVFGSVENVFDHRVETGRSSAGLVNVGNPRLVLIGVRLHH